MTNFRTIDNQLCDALELRRRPVAVAFRENPPAGLSKFAGTVPSGCSFWRLAAEGRTFYTVPGDHYNCPIGSHTHNIPLPDDRASELPQALSLMAGAGYIRMEEIPGIHRLEKTPGVVIYAPLGSTPVDPDVVLVSGRPGRIMLLAEAALAAGVGAQSPLLARPTCMAIPAAMAQGVVASSGCIGNRVYTDIGEDELYVVIPGRHLATVAGQLRTTAEANAQLAAYHRQRRETLTAG